MDAYMYTNVGNRPVNEDSANFTKVSDSELLCIVADGLGGHGRGEVASKLVVDIITEEAKNSGIADGAFFDNSIMLAQENLLKAQRDLNADNEMKTTLVALKVCGSTAQWCHVGDTRLYMWKKGKLSTRTLDHSVPQMLVASGEIKEKQIRFHEDRNRLIRVMGVKWNTPKYELSEPVAVQEGDAFLLCTDGFWEYITEKEMQKCLKKSKSAAEWMEKMAVIVHKRGKKSDMDNNTAISVII